MNLERINHWLALTANLGVLIGVIFLAVEMRQNTNAINGQSRHAIFAGAQEQLFKFLEYPELTILLASNETELSLQQKVQIDSLLVSALRAREFAWRQYNAGILEQASWDTELEIISILVGSKRSKKWWDQVGVVQFNGEFQKIVSRFSGEKTEHPFWLKILSWE